MQSFNTVLSDEQLAQILLHNRSADLHNRKRIEILLVVSGNQPFAILMTQVHNIVRPGPGGIEVLREPDSSQPFASGEIYYQGSGLTVLELPRALQLPLVEPINRSRILVCGKLQQDGSLESPYGVAIEDVIAVKSYTLDDLRLLPKWIANGIPGLIWGAVLVEREILFHEKTLDSGVLEPVNFGDFSFLNGAPSLLSDLNSDGAEIVPPNWTNLSKSQGKPGKATDTKAQNGQTLKDATRPVMLLDLEVLRGVLFDKPEKIR